MTGSNRHAGDHGRDGGKLTPHLHSLYLLFSKRVTRSVQGNKKPDHFIRPEIARAVHKSEGFVFPNKD